MAKVSNVNGLEFVGVPDIPVETQAKFLRQFNDDWETAKNHIAPKHKQFNEFYKSYLNHKDPTRPSGIANCPVPLTKNIINVVVADMVDKTFGTNLQIDTDPRQEYSDDLMNTANRDVIRYQAYIDSWKPKLRELYTNIFLYGGAPAKVFYKEEYGTFTVQEPITWPGIPGAIDSVARQARELIYKGASLEVIDPLDFYPDPAMLDINDELPVIQTCNIPPSRLYSNRRRFVGDDEKGLYNNVEFMMRALRNKEFSLGDQDIDQFKKERQEITGDNLQYKIDHAKLIRAKEWQGYFDINGDGVPEKVIALIARLSTEDREIDVILRLDENPYFHGHKTWLFGRIFRATGQFWGIGLADAIGPQQEAATSLRNSMLDAYYKLSRPRIYTREDALVDPKSVDKPWGIVEIHDDGNPIGNSIQEQHPISIGPDGHYMSDAITSDANNASGVQPIKSGANPGQKMTATVGNIIHNQATLLFSDMLKQVEDSLLVPLADMANFINQQFIDTTYAVQVIGRKGRHWRKILPQDIAGQRHFISLASQKNQEKTILAEQLLKAIQVAGANPQLMPAAIIAYIEMWETLDLPNLELVKTALGYYQMIPQLIQANTQQVMPYQQMLQQDLRMGLDPQGNGRMTGGNFNPYSTSQQRAPSSPEEAISSLRAGVTRNMPTTY